MDTQRGEKSGLQKEVCCEKKSPPCPSGGRKKGDGVPHSIIKGGRSHDQFQAHLRKREGRKKASVPIKLSEKKKPETPALGEKKRRELDGDKKASKKGSECRAPDYGGRKKKGAAGNSWGKRKKRTDAGERGSPGRTHMPKATLPTEGRKKENCEGVLQRGKGEKKGAGAS